MLREPDGRPPTRMVGMVVVTSAARKHGLQEEFRALGFGYSRAPGDSPHLERFEGHWPGSAGRLVFLHPWWLQNLATKNPIPGRYALLNPYIGGVSRERRKPKVYQAKRSRTQCSHCSTPPCGSLAAGLFEKVLLGFPSLQTRHLMVCDAKEVWA